MPHHPSAFGLTARYNDFLFAPISDQENGMQLSVLSALARANVDPWEAAARIEAMHPEDAEWALVEMFSKVPGRTWNLSEAKVIAKKLVQLLPHATRSASITGAETKTDGARLLNFWLIWLGFIIAMSLFQPPHNLTPTSSSVAVHKYDKGNVQSNGTNKTFFHE
ncbi:MAG: hypothetical protein ACRD4Q_02545 [Candidatus Acidiferrales bacterium]